MKQSEWDLKQRDICKRFGVEPCPAPPGLKVGIARNVKEQILPLQAIRHPPQGDTTGWYIFAGEEMSRDPDFFVPLHVEHLDQWCPLVIPYLQLPPGWGVVLAPDYEDVYFNESLLHV
jgi:hypothetical protein